jgi:hypothetical protein
MIMTLNQESVLFFYELGQAIRYWTYVEHDLRHLVTASVVDDDKRMLSIGFISIESFQSKLTFCSSIISERYQGSSDFERWRALSSRLQSAKVLRDRLGHWTVMVYPLSREGRRYALMNSKEEQLAAPMRGHADRPGKSPPMDAMCIREIVAARNEFEALRHALQNLRSALLGLMEYHKELEIARPALTASALWYQLNEQLK